jgi:hypothetical protein
MDGVAQEDFAGEVLAAVRAAGVVEAWYDRGQFAIGYRDSPEDTDATGWVFLRNVFHECQGDDPAERADRVRRLVTGVVGPKSPLPTAWAEVRPRLRPVLRGATFGQQGPMAAPLSRPALPYLREFVVIDTPTTMAYVLAEKVAEWGVTEAEVFAVARANVSGQVGEPGDGSPTIVRFVDDGDAYFVGRLLVDGWLAGLAGQVGGRPVAFIPDHSTLIVGPDRPDGLATLYEMAESDYTQAARSLSPQGYTVDDRGRVVPYRAPAGHPLAAAVHRAETILAHTEYEAQAEVLKQELERDDIDIFVATLMVMGRPDGSLFSVATWGRDVDSLLPAADYVAFVSDDGLFQVPWPVVADEVDLRPVDRCYPLRYRVGDWPEPGVLNRLRTRAVNP